MDVQPAPEKKEQKMEVSELGEFDMDYFKSLGGDGWIALGMEGCKNQRYFTVYSDEGEKVGIVGVYDTNDEENISHTVIDPKFRGQGLARQAKEKLMEKLDLPFLILIIDLGNASSLGAAEKIDGAEIVSDEAYEKYQHKRKYRWERKRG